MQKKLISLFCIWGSLFYFTSTASLSAKQAPESFADLAESLLPAVVNISTTQVIKSSQQVPALPEFPKGSPFHDFFEEFRRGFPEQQDREATSLGSGFIIDPKGFIVTNNHVIDKANEIKVIFHDNTELKAKLIGRDPKTDIALLKVEAKKDLPFVKFGDSDKMRVGDWVVAIGNPFGLGGTVTAGIVSARSRVLRSGPYDDYIQTDASINKGNSGGPMFNIKGEVVGINTAIVSPSGGSVGIGFAVPSILANNVIEQLKQYGHTKRGWLGVRIQHVSEEIAESLGLNEAYGALVVSLSEKGPAAKAGVKVGDIILKLNDKKVPEMRNLPIMVAETEIDKTVPLTVWRNKKEVDLKVKIGLLDEENNVVASKDSQDDFVKTLGLSLSKLTDNFREKYEIDTAIKGVLVTNVETNSVAAKNGFRNGDVIEEVLQKQVTKPEEIIKIIKDAKKDNKSSILFLIKRNNEAQFIGLRLDS